MNKKGELSDMLVWVITIFIFAVGLFILAYVSPQIIGGLKTAGLNSSSAASNAIEDTQATLGVTINSGFLILFSGFVISMLISSFLVRTHPIFIFLYIFFLIISLVLALYVGNAYYDLQNNSVFVDNQDNTSFINTIMNHLVEITLAVGAISLIVMFSKFSTYGGSQPF
jgi:hypothetical protein